MSSTSGDADESMIGSIPKVKMHWSACPERRIGKQGNSANLTQAHSVAPLLYSTPLGVSRGALGFHYRIKQGIAGNGDFSS